MTGVENVRVFLRDKVWLENSLSQSEGGWQVAVDHPKLSETLEYTVCPIRYRTRHYFNNFTINEDFGALQTHTTDTFIFISHTTKLLLFKFRCSIFIGVRIIK